jgi:flagella basal body P-ring formation protein FlgA
VVAGSRATLWIEAERLHIKVLVVCLEKGVPGQTIRVSSLDRKQTYRAEVIDSTQLKGKL